VIRLAGEVRKNRKEAGICDDLSYLFGEHGDLPGVPRSSSMASLSCEDDMIGTSVTESTRETPGQNKQGAWAWCSVTTYHHWHLVIRDIPCDHNNRL